jgi:hypothetical protein
VLQLTPDQENTEKWTKGRDIWNLFNKIEWYNK